MSYNENDAIPTDAPVEYEGGFSVIPEGEYFFKVLSVERKQSEGGPNSPPHTKMNMTLQIENAEGHSLGQVKDDLPMFMKFVWKYNDFAKSIGMVKPDEKNIFVDWKNVPGSEGKCKLTIRKYEKRDGTTGEQNQVKYLIPSPDAATFDPDSMPSSDTAEKDDQGW